MKTQQEKNLPDTPSPHIRQHAGRTVITRFKMPEDADSRTRICREVLRQELRKQGA